VCCDVDQGWINQPGYAPRVWKTEATSPVTVGQTVTVSARFTDPGREVIPEAQIDWGDGSIETVPTTSPVEGNGRAAVNGTHNDGMPGLYTVKVTVTDSDGNAGWDTFRHVAVYDQQAGTVDSKKVTFTDPAGTPSLELTARYEKDATTPTAKVAFTLGDLSFQATSFAWMVVEGDAVFVRGEGLVGADTYQFLVSAVDGKPDMVRVRIWAGNGPGADVLYDSAPGALLDTRPTTPIGKGGDITIEKN
jgi:hypothetical protein